MKELSIEEKAQAYDEALKRAKTLYENANGMILKKWVEQVFPELKESEDERIRKELIKGISKTRPNTPFLNTNITREDALVWFEKQKPTEDNCKNSDDITTEEKDMTEYNKGFECGKQRVLKYPEDFGLCKKTLTAWGEEDEKYLKHAIEDFQKLGDSYLTFWLKSLKDRVQPQPKNIMNGIPSPIFAIGDTIKAKPLPPGVCGINLLADWPREIVDITDKYYILSSNQAIEIRYQDQWELAK